MENYKEGLGFLSWMNCDGNVEQDNKDGRATDQPGCETQTSLAEGRG